MKIDIRAINDNDYDEVAVIYSDESVLENTTQIPYRNAGFWQSFYSSKAENTVELVATTEGRIAGHLGILLNSNPRRRHVASFGIAVHPNFQGRGVGKALMGELVRLADNWLNLFRIELQVASDNETAIALYKKFDFEIEGESKYDLFTRGRYGNTLWMARFNPNSQMVDPETG